MPVQPCTVYVQLLEVSAYAELNGEDIEAEHCLAEHMEGKVYLTPLSGATSVNTETVTCREKLTHGMLIIDLYVVLYI